MLQVMVMKAGLHKRIIHLLFEILKLMQEKDMSIGGSSTPEPYSGNSWTGWHTGEVHHSMRPARGKGKGSHYPKAGEECRGTSRGEGNQGGTFVCRGVLPQSRMKSLDLRAPKESSSLCLL